jgi:hypothetical protein
MFKYIAIWLSERKIRPLQNLNTLLFTPYVNSSPSNFPAVNFMFISFDTNLIYKITLCDFVNFDNIQNMISCHVIIDIRPASLSYMNINFYIHIVCLRNVFICFISGRARVLT